MDYLVWTPDESDPQWPSSTEYLCIYYVCMYSVLYVQYIHTYIHTVLHTADAVTVLRSDIGKPLISPKAQLQR